MKTNQLIGLILRLFIFCLFHSSLSLFGQSGFVQCPNDGFDIFVVPEGGSCEAFVNANATLTGANCGPTFSSDAFSGEGISASGFYPVGTTTVTFFSNCEEGNSCTVNIIVNPQPIECLTQNNVIVFLDSDGTYTLDPSEVDNGSFSPCAEEEVSLSVSPNMFTCNDVLSGGITVQLTVEDEFEQFTTCDVLVNVADPNPIDCVTQPYTAYLDANGDVSINVADIDDGTSAACPVNLSLDMTDFDCSDVGTQTINLIAESTTNSELNTSCPAQLTVLDTIPPTCNVMDITVTYDPAGTFVIPSDFDAGTTDNCDGSLRTINDQDVIDLTCLDIGTQTVTLSAEDESGNTSTCTAMLTVEANGDLVTCATQDITVQLDADGMATITAADVDDGSTSECGTPTLSVTPSSFDCSQIGANTVVLTVSDDAGNSMTCEAVVTVEDVMAPTCNAQDVTVYLDEDGEVVIEIDSLIGDAVSGIFLSNSILNNESASCCDINNDGIDEILLDTGNEILALYDLGGSTYDINDPSTEVLLTSNGIWIFETGDINNDGHCDIIVTDVFGTHIYENINGTYNFQLTLNGSTNGGGQRCVITDLNNDGSLDIVNTNNPDVLIHLNDGTGNFATPIIFSLSVGGTVSHCEDLDSDGDIDLIIQPFLSQQSYTIIENLGSGNFTEISTNIAYAFANLVLIDIDGDGDLDYINSASQNSIALNDGSTLPNHGSFSSFAFNSQVTSLGSGLNIINGQFFSFNDIFSKDLNNDGLTDILLKRNTQLFLSEMSPAGFADNCTVQSVTLSQEEFDCTDLGAPTDVTITVTDQSGNISQCNSMVTVLDTIPPTCNAMDITVNLQNGTYTLDPSEIDNGSTENCDVTLSVSPNTFDCMDVGTPMTVTLTAIDPSGNTSTCTAEVTVNSIADPVCVTQDITINLDANGEASYTAADIDGGSTVECGTVTLSASPTQFDCSQIGANTVLLTVSDAFGNSSSCPATVTVLDTEAPTCVSQDITVSLDQDGMATIVASDVDAGSFDNCGPVDLSIDVASFDCTDTGGATVNDCLEDFDSETDATGSSVGNWNATAGTVNFLDDPITGSKVLRGDDGSGASWMGNDIDFDFDWIAAYDGLELCFDLRYDNGNPSNPATGFNSIFLYDDTAGTTNASPIGANFIRFNFTAGVANTWVRVCAPIELSQGGVPPQNANGMWTESTPGVYDQVIQNVQGIAFPLDFTGGSNPSEMLFVDNICIEGSTCPSTTLTVTDQSGNSTSCTAMVKVIDDLAPICPTGVDLTVQLEPGQCDTTYVFDLPIAIDNCDLNPISTPIIGQPMSGDIFEIGTTTIEYEIADASGNTDTCSFNIEVLEHIPEVMPCLSDINFSLDPYICEGVLTPEMLLTTLDDVGCADSCSIIIKDAHSNVLPNIITADAVDQDYTYEICCGGHCCWGNILVEYKGVPQLNCGMTQQVTACSVENIDLSSVILPTTSSACTEVSLTIVSETFEKNDTCDPDDLLGTMTRCYVGEDTFGNVSPECCQTIEVMRLDLGEITFPDDVIIEDCTESTDPSVTGVPTIDVGGISFDSLTLNLSSSSIQYFIIDHDKDGDNDLLVWDIFSGLYIAENDGLNNFNSTNVFYDVSQVGFLAILRDIRIIDLNNDGFPDIYLGNNGINNSGEILLNDQSGSFVTNSQLFADIFLDVIDVNGDSFLDLIVNAANSSGELWLNDMSGSFTNTGHSLQYNSRSSFFDLDNDGDLDLLAGNGNSYILYNYNESSGFTPINNLNGNNFFAPIITDFNNDGLSDVFLPSSTSSIWINSTSGLIAQNQVIDNSTGRMPSIADFNNDGYLDIFVLGFNIGEIWLNDGTGAFNMTGQSLQTNTNSSSGGTGTRYLGDIDNDGDIDILTGIAGSLGGGLDLWFNDGQGLFTNAGVFPFSAIELIDIDLDGDLDIVRRHNNDANGIWENIGSGEFRLIETFSNINSIENINNDGKPDIILGNGDILLNTSTPQFSQSLYPTIPTELCNIGVTYTDLPIITTDCSEKFLRVWEVNEWWCNSEVRQSHPQYITIKDKVGPEITCGDDLSLSTGHDCAATVTFPQITATDNCSEVGRISVTIPASTDGSFIGMVIPDITTDNPAVDLPVGEYTVTYRAHDACDNITECTIQVSVVDDTQPIAICDFETVVSVGGSVEAFVYADAIDAGSFDECGIDQLLIRRMDPDACNHPGNQEWGEKVAFCCADAGQTHMVSLQVIDKAGNSNQCMVSVVVQDKTPPVLTCPDDQTIDCEVGFDIDNLALQFSNATLVDDCSDNYTIAETYETDIDDCGLGTIERIFTVMDGDESLNILCTQTITIENSDPFDFSTIDWPDETIEVYNACDLSVFDPITLDAMNEYQVYPEYTAGHCDQIAYNYEDTAFDAIIGDDVCYKVQRKWKVIDWCQTSGSTLVIDSFVQTLKLYNDIAPTLEACTDATFSSSTAGCDQLNIDLVGPNGADDCTDADDLVYSYQVVLESGSILNSDGQDASGFYPFGVHQVTWSVTDGCGNVTSCTQQFSIYNETIPTPKCNGDVLATLNPVDTDGDGIPDNGEVELWASDFDLESDHPCGYDLQLSFSPTVFEPNMTFDCSHLGQNDVSIYYTALDEDGNILLDASGNPLQAECVAGLMIQQGSNMSLCPEVPRLQISGRIVTESGIEVKDVEVYLENSPNMSETSEAGEYILSDVAGGGQYRVAPYSDKDPSNGVSTLDIIMIQRHLLNIQPLSSAYQLIAADADGNGYMSASDLVDIRKLVLEITQEFPNNTSWRFVDALQEFIDQDNPWAHGLDEAYDIYSLDSDMVIDFIGVKTGDVNGSVQMDAQGKKVEVRNEDYSLAVYHEEGQIHLHATEDIAINGFQLSISGEGSIQDIISELNNFNEEDFYIDGNTVKISYSAEYLTQLMAGDRLLTLTTDGDFDIKLSSDYLNECYEGDHLERRNLVLDTQSGQLKIKSMPNPWVDQVTITIESDESGMAEGFLYDSSGRRVRDYTIELKGRHQTLIVDGPNLSNGFYTFRLIKDGKSYTHRLLKVE